MRWITATETTVTCSDELQRKFFHPLTENRNSWTPQSDKQETSDAASTLNTWCIFSLKLISSSSPTERLLSQLHHQTFTFPLRADVLTVWRATLLLTFNHRSRQERRRGDKYSSSLWLTLFSLPVSHQHVLFFSLLSCHTWLMLAGSQRQSVDALNNIFRGGQEVRSQSRQRPDQLYRWSHDKFNIWQEKRCRTTLNQTSGFNITNIFLTSGICPFTVNLLYTRKHT